MARKKGTLKSIVETVGEAIQTVGAEVGLVTTDTKPKSKSARKAVHKAVIEKAQQDKTDRQAKHAARLRAMV